MHLTPPSPLLGLCRSLLFGAALSAAVGCGASTPPGARSADLEAAKTRAGAGASLYDRACATCHGPRGEGLAGAPPIIGITGLPRYPRDASGVQLYQDPQQIQRQAQLRVPGSSSRPEFVTAKDVHDYLRRHTTEVERPAGAGDLPDRDLWAILGFVLIAHGSAVPPEGLSPENAATVLIRSE